MNKALLGSMLAGSLLFAGCTVHPPGEDSLRHEAAAAATQFARPVGERVVTPLPEVPSGEDLVRYALQSNADLERRYWEWWSAIEQIPQDGTQTTNLALFAGLGITNGSTRLGDTTLGLGNDPMSDIVLPNKLGIAANRALQNARAAGLRFRKAQFELRAKVLSAYADFALAAELSRLEASNAELLETTAMAVEARIQAGTGGQQDLLKVRNELALSRNDIATLDSQVRSGRAQLNSLLGRAVDDPLPAPTSLPPQAPLSTDDGTILTLAADRNPELSALAHEVSAKKEGIQLAKLQYLPDFSLSGGTDLTGVAQSLTGMVTLPVLRYQAINAAVAQAEANLRASDAMRRQAKFDLAAQVVMNLVAVRDSDRQLELFSGTVVPRAEQVVAIARSSYEAGQSTLLDFLDAQRSLVTLRRLVANLQASREKHLVELESVSARPLGGATPP